MVTDHQAAIEKLQTIAQNMNEQLPISCRAVPSTKST